MAFETVFSFLDIRWSLSSKDAGDVNGVSGGGVNAVKVRDKLSANGGIGKVSFHHTEFALSVVFTPIKFNSLVLYHLKFTLMRPVSVDISNNTGVLEIYNGIVDEKSRSGRGVEDIEVIIFDPRVVEIGGGVCSYIKGNGVFRVSLFANSYNVGIDPHLSEGNVSCYFVLTVLIEEDKGVLPCITAVVLAPSISWVIQVVKLLSKLGNVGDGTRCGGKGNGGVIFSKPNWFVTLNIVV